MTYKTNAAKNRVACCNASQVDKLKMHLLQHLLVFQSWYNLTSMLHESYVVRQDKLVA